MDKNQILSLVQQKLADGTITQADLAPLLPTASSAPAPVSAASAGVSDGHSSLISKVLYTLGALIVIIGAGILIADNWDVLGTGGRILVSLGLSVIAYTFGLVSAERGSRKIASVAYVVSVVMAPFGVGVVFYELDIDPTLPAQAIAALIAAAFFGFASLRSKLPVPVLGFAASATWAYYALILDVSDRFGDPQSVLRAATIIAGVAYAAVAWRPAIAATQSIEIKQASALRGLFGFIAVGSILAVAFSFEPDWRLVAALCVAGSMWFGVVGRLQMALLPAIIAIFGTVFVYDGIWLVLPLALSFGSIYAAIAARSSFVLFLAAATVVASVTRVGNELFGDYLGWSVSLIAFGLLLIGSGYAAVQLNKRYIKN